MSTKGMIDLVPISLFYGIMVCMDEREAMGDTPHIHAFYKDDEVEMDFDEQVLSGNLPPKKLRMLQVWVDLRRENLEAVWNCLKRFGEYLEIDPLR